MRSVREIYEQYEIMPNLQLHQLRVTAVAKIICDNFTQPIAADDVVLACLFHDMGNIIKFNLELFPEFRAEKGIEYWAEVKKTYGAKYGSDHHAATSHIAREIGLSDQVVSYVDSVAFSHLEVLRDGTSFESKICEYSDLRVGPYGVLALQERMDEARARYASRSGAMGRNEEEYLRLASAAHEIEDQIFSTCSVKPEEITDVSIAPVIEKLWDYPVP